MYRHRVGKFLLGALVAATAVTGFASPAVAKRKAPNACKVVTTDDVAEVTGAVDIADDGNTALARGRAGTCVYELEGGTIGTSDPRAAQVSIYFSPVVKGRGYIASTGVGITKLKIFKQKPFDQAIIGYTDGTWVLVAQKGPKTAMLIVQPGDPTELTKVELKEWAIKLTKVALA